MTLKPPFPTQVVPGSVLQIAVGCLVSVVFLVLGVYFDPYADESNNEVAFAANAVTFLSFFAALLLSDEFKADRDRRVALGYLLVAVRVGPPRGDVVSHQSLSREALFLGDLSPRESAARGVQNSQESVPTRYIEWDGESSSLVSRSLEDWTLVLLGDGVRDRSKHSTQVDVRVTRPHVCPTQVAVNLLVVVMTLEFVRRECVADVPLRQFLKDGFVKSVKHNISKNLDQVKDLAPAHYKSRIEHLAKRVETSSSKTSSSKDPRRGRGRSARGRGRHRGPDDDGLEIVSNPMARHAAAHERRPRDQERGTDRAPSRAVAKPAPRTEPEVEV